MFLKLSCIVLVLFLFPVPATACSWLAQTTSRVYIFSDNLLAGNPFREYYFTFPHRKDNCTHGSEKNIEEWQLVYPEARNRAAFDQLIYNTPIEKLTQLRDYLLKNCSNSLQGNALAALLVRKRDTAALNYLVFAKQCEPYALNYSFSWQEPEKADAGKMNALVEQGLKGYRDARPMFFRQRYAFQLVRLLVYMGEAKKALAVYSQLVTPQMPCNYIYYRTLMHRAAALAQINRPLESMALSAAIFEKSPELRCLAFYDFNVEWGRITR